MKIGLHLTTFDRLKFTKHCLKSLEWSAPKSTIVVIVDNSSTDGTKEFLKSYFLSYIKKIIFNDKNEGLGFAINQGWNILKDECDILGQVNNDFLFEPGWESNVISCFEDLDLGWILGTVNAYWGKREEDVEQYVKTNTKVTKSGKGFYLSPKPGGAGFILSKYWKSGVISLSSRPFEKGYVGAGPSFYNSIQKVAKGVRLGHPGILVRDAEYTNPEYEKYYDETFGVRGLTRHLKEHRWNESQGRVRFGTWEDFVKKYYPSKSGEEI